MKLPLPPVVCAVEGGVREARNSSSLLEEEAGSLCIAFMDLVSGPESWVLGGRWDLLRGIESSVDVREEEWSSIVLEECRSCFSSLSRPSSALACRYLICV